MKRKEIKFRGFDKETKKMFDWSWFIGSEVGEMFDNEDYEIMQFTGLKDRNGKQIYEGDILRFTEVDEDSCMGDEETHIGEVRWLDDIGQYRFIYNSGQRTELHFVLQLPWIKENEIIGNIYQDIHLLDNTDTKIQN